MVLMIDHGVNDWWRG